MPPPLQHIYNNEGSLSPFAGLAFNPIDGIVQASPYIFGMFLFPIHVWTHLGMLFFTAIWTTNIHDTLTGAWKKAEKATVAATLLAMLLRFLQ
jgi:hypothetical protein